MWHWFLVSFIFTSVALAEVITAPLTTISFEQNPSGIKWRHIVTEHFDIIFPQEIESDAQRVAHLLEKAYPFVTRSLDERPARLPLVLQNQSTMSNGFMTLAPRRSEWYLTPTFNPVLTNTEWLKTLAIHEYRHTVQFEKGRRGFNKFLYIILGEIGQAVGLGLTLPPWFYEGDAVGIETALTRGGRGRLPLFERDLRTLLLSDKDWTYDKSHLGSFEDYVPNHYVYGYFYTSYLRNMYGDLFLAELSNQSAETSWNPLSFYNSTHKLTQKSFESFYEHVMKDLILEWKKKADALTPTPYEVKSVGNSFGWTNYDYPQALEDGSIVALKRGLSFYDRFVLIQGKKEKTLFYPAPLMEEYPFKVRKGKMAYLEWDLDPRWGYRDYTRLKVYDVNQDQFVIDIPQKKWRLAVIDHKGEKILLAEWSKSQNQYILILNSEGEEILRFPFPKEEVITSLEWLNESEVLLITKDYNDQKSLVKLNLTSKATETLIEKNVTNLGAVAVEEGHIFFESPASGIDNIWLYSESGPRQITSALFGAYAPTLSKGKLLYNDYSVKGMNVVSKTLPWEEEQKSQDSFFPVFEKFAKTEGFELLDQEFKKQDIYPSESYSQTTHAINPHSWILLAPPLGASVIVQGFSRDILNNFNLSVGASYNLNEQVLQGFTTATWNHYYPVFDVRAAYGNRRQDVLSGGQKFENTWEEGTAELGVSIPWKYLQGRLLHSFSMRAFAKLIKVTNKISSDSTDVTDGALYSPGGEFSYTLFSRMSRRDINPEWGLSTYGHLEDGGDITGNDQKGSIRSLDSRIYLPGLWHHHSFFHQFAYEKQQDDSYQYSSFIFYPRGTKSVFLQEFTKYSANYTFPLFYPDWNLSRYFYLKRLYLNLFYDELIGRYESSQYRAASTGWETIFEMNFFRLALPISIGLRGSYVLDGIERSTNYEIFLAGTLGTF